VIRGHSQRRYYFHADGIPWKRRVRSLLCFVCLAIAGGQQVLAMGTREARQVWSGELQDPIASQLGPSPSQVATTDDLVKRAGCVDPFIRALPQTEPPSDKETSDPYKVLEQPAKNVTFHVLFSAYPGALLDDSGKPVMVRNEDGRLSAIIRGWRCWKASDGGNAFENYFNLVSTDFASDYLAKKIVDAKVLRREPRVNQKGEAIGERIIALLSLSTELHRRGPNDPHVMVAIVIHLDGVHYSEVYSYSLETTLSLEGYLEKKDKAADAPKLVRKN
jgi:hypothetical protein